MFYTGVYSQGMALRFVGIIGLSLALIGAPASAVAADAAPAASSEAARGMKPLTVVDERGGTVVFGSSRALIIGNSAYTAGWDELPGVRGDVTAVQAGLERQGFEVRVAQNLTKTQLADTLDTYIAEQAQDPTGRVIIYYAGHGQSVGSVGYLVPVDAPPTSDPLFRAKAYPIATLKIKAQEAQARHVLFACDACFAGSVFVPMRGAGTYVLSAAREPVRMFLTAGSANETVPDVSFFRQEFLRGIGGAADLNHDGFVTGSELATYVKQNVRDRAGAMGKSLTPQAGVSEQEGLNRGDFIFRVPEDPPVIATAAVAQAPAGPPATPADPLAGAIAQQHWAAARALVDALPSQEQGVQAQRLFVAAMQAAMEWTKQRQRGPALTVLRDVRASTLAELCHTTDQYRRVVDVVTTP